MVRPLLMGLLGAAAAMTAVLATAPPVRAATITVTTTIDEVVVNGACSLREAVLAANTNTAVDSCPAGGTGLDSIELTPGHYALTIAGVGEDAALTGDLDVLGPTIFDGDDDSSPNATQIDGGGLDRVFDVHAIGERVSFRRLTITGGSAAGEDGGGIRVPTEAVPTGEGCPAETRVALNLVVVRDSAANSGGGIFLDTCAHLESEWSSIVDNTAVVDGGGIALATMGTVNVVESTLSGNVAGGAGGGLWLQGDPLQGGLFFTTVAHNAAAAGGGVWIGPAVTSAFALSSTILAHNQPDQCQLANPVTVMDSLSTDDSCGISAEGNLPSTDPLLHPRDDDPVAYRLRTGSPAIDAGDPRFEDQCTHLFVDQYSRERPVDGDGDGAAVCDIGSSEAPAVPVQPSPSASPSGPSTPTDPGPPVLPDTAAERPSTWPFVELVAALAALTIAAARRHTRIV